MLSSPQKEIQDTPREKVNFGGKILRGREIEKKEGKEGEKEEGGRKRGISPCSWTDYFTKYIIKTSLANFSSLAKLYNKYKQRRKHNRIFYYLTSPNK